MSIDSKWNIPLLHRQADKKAQHILGRWHETEITVKLVSALNNCDTPSSIKCSFDRQVMKHFIILRQHLPPQAFLSHQFWQTLSEIIGPTRLCLYADLECFHWTQHYIGKELGRSAGSQVQWRPPQVRIFLASTIPTPSDTRHIIFRFCLISPGFQLHQSLKGDMQRFFTKLMKK